MANIQKRVRDDGTVSFRVQIRLKDQPAQTATFEGKNAEKKARDWAVRTEAAIKQGRHFKTVEARKHSMADLIDRYLETVNPQKKSADTTKQQLLWWREQVGSRPLADINAAVMVECRDLLGRTPSANGKPRSATTLNRYMGTLSHVFSVASREWEWMTDNPIARIKPLKQPRGRVRFLSDDERARLLAACRESKNRALFPIVLVGLSTGMRYSEILELTLDDVDLERGRIVLQETKNGERRLVPLVGPALKELREWCKVRRLDTRLIFPGKKHADRPMDIGSAWDSAIERSGLEDFHFHDLRHSAASYLAMSGASLAEIAEVLGHETLAMVKRYAQLTCAVWKMDPSSPGSGTPLSQIPVSALS